MLHTVSALVSSPVPGNDASSTASAASEAKTPSRPRSSRPAISAPADDARPLNSDAAANRSVPARQTRRRPARSPARPPSSRKPPDVRV
jgi:hypothetical protein